MASRTIADRYDLLDRLGQGGSGTVWRAHDRSLDRIVAIKEILIEPSLPADQRARVKERGLREARAAARLEHRNVVSIYDARSDDDAIHIIMEFVDAPSLQQVVERDGPMAPEQVAALGIEILDALAAAHEVGIVHRDIKPSNVLVPAGGGALVTDFGIATVMGESALTVSGEALGTPDFVSPEQVRGEDATPVTDLWSLGGTLFLAVEGTAPFRRDRPISTVHAVVHDEPPAMNRAGALAPVLQGMLSKAPDARPSLAEVRDQLVAVVEGTASQTATTALPAVDDDRTHEIPRVAAAASLPYRDTVQPTAVAAPTPETWDTEPPPPAQDGASSSDDHRPGSSAVLVLLAVAALVIAVAVVAILSSGDDATPEVPAPTATDTAEADPTPTATATQIEPTASPTPTEAETTASPSPTPTETTEPVLPELELPSGWTAYEGPSYTVGHPQAWTTRDTGVPNNIDLVAPNDADGYLRVAHTDSPAEDVLQDTERIEAAFQDGNADYQRIRLEPTTYRDADAVIWEYTFTADGQPYHAIHLNMNTGENGYALNHVVPESGWGDAAGRFEQFTESFSYPGS